MKNRNIIVVGLLSLFTTGIYSIFWLVMTKHEVKSHGVNIPSLLFLAIPLVNIWWLWKYSQGVENITSGTLSAILVFVLLLFISPIGIVLVQDSFNNLADSDSPTTTTPPATPTPPTFSATPPATVG